MSRTLLLAALVITLAACTTARKPDHEEAPSLTEEERQARVETAQDALVPLKTGLQGALQEAMQEGPEAAIEVCRLEAPRLADEASTDGIRVGRTSHRVRNPGNEPEAWMQPYLDEFLDEPAQPGTHRETVLDDGRFAYVEPIYMQPMCTACHGPREDLVPTIQATLDEQYPDDEATGFEAGDFRGLFWVTLE